MSFATALAWLSAAAKKAEADLEAVMSKTIPILETIFADAAVLEPYIAVFAPQLNVIPGIQPALAAMPGILDNLQKLLGPGTGAQKLQLALAQMQAVSTQAQTVLTGGARNWTAEETAEITKIVNNAVAAAKDLSLVNTPVAPCPPQQAAQQQTAAQQAGVAP